jgi:hypothetical protein
VKMMLTQRSICPIDWISQNWFLIVVFIAMKLSLNAQYFFYDFVVCERPQLASSSTAVVR